MLACRGSSLSRFFASALNIKPLGGRVLVELDKATEKVGSLYLPQSAQQQTNQGKVLAVGPGALIDGKIVPVTVSVGQRVLLPTYGGQIVKLEKAEYTIIDETNILAVFD
jgi:chaperonin GroES